LFRALDYASDQLGIARPPHQVRPDRDDREVRGVRRQRGEFGRGLGARVTPTGPFGIGRLRTDTEQRVPGMRYRRGRHLHEPLDARRVRSDQQLLGADHIDADKLVVAADDSDLGCQVHDGLGTGDSVVHRLAGV
jgi:hypothetical protein